jgi:hypothetical protein
MAGHSPAPVAEAIARRYTELGGATTMLPTEDAARVAAELARRGIAVFAAGRHHQTDVSTLSGEPRMGSDDCGDLPSRAAVRRLGDCRGESSRRWRERRSMVRGDRRRAGTIRCCTGSAGIPMGAQPSHGAGKILTDVARLSST